VARRNCRIVVKLITRRVSVSKRIYCLIKIFDSEEYAKAFLDTGEIFCRAFEEFKNIDDGNRRGDRFEGASQWFQPKDVKITLSARNKNDEILHTVNIEESDLAGPVISQPALFDGFNAFCMHAVAIEDFEESYSTEDQKNILKAKINRSIARQTKIDPQCEDDFGDYAVVIYRVERFIEAVVSHAEHNNRKIWHGLVEYFDPETFTGSFNGIEAIFRKSKTYSHQNEFRFVFKANNKTQGAIKFNVGPLNEIAFMGPLKDIISGLEIKI